MEPPRLLEKMELLDILSKPAQHVTMGFFCFSDHLFVASIISHSPSMRNTEKYLHKVVNLKK